MDILKMHLTSPNTCEIYRGPSLSMGTSGTQHVSSLFSEAVVLERVAMEAQKRGTRAWRP